MRIKSIFTAVIYVLERLMCFFERMEFTHRAQEADVLAFCLIA
jgi:hypothetical protein